MDSAGSSTGNQAVGTPPLLRDVHRWWTLSAYGALALPLSLAEIPILLYLPAFYAKELALTASLVGLVFLLARLGDGFADVIVGWLSDRSTSRFGRRKPWVLIGAPFLMLSTWFLCNPPDGAGLTYLCLWVALFYMAFTAVKIPHISWGTELATDYVQRSRVTTFREAFTFIGNLIFASVPLLFLANSSDLGAVLTLLALAALLAVPLATVGIGLFVPDPPLMSKPKVPLFKGLGEVLRDPVMRRFCGAVLCQWTATGMINSLAVFSFGVGLQMPNQLFFVVLILYVATLCVMPLFMMLARRIDKHHLIVAGLLVHAIAISCHVLVPRGNEMAVYLLWVAIAFGVAPTVILPTSMLADIVDHGEVRNGKRRAGAYVAVFNLMCKIGSALGVGIAFVLLDIIHFNARATTYSASDIFNIRLVGFVLPALLLVPPMILFLGYPITRARHRELRDLIQARGLDRDVVAAGA